MRRALGWMCYRIVMAWPGTWPSGAAAGWILAWAGDYANDPPNNLMAGHGDPDYLKSNGNSIRHVDCRESKPRRNVPNARYPT